MKESHSPLRRIVALTAFALVTLAVAGCTKKVTVDPGYTMPEGRYQADARMILYPDISIPVEVWRDTVPEGPSDTDWLLYSETVTLSPGSMYGAIMDGTPATAYQVLRRERNGGFSQLSDYLLNPSQRFLDSQWEMYVFQDAHPSGYSPATYVGRGVVAGQVTTSSPLTNLAEQVEPATVQPLIYTGEAFPADSNISMSWRAVDDAVGYWIQIYDFKGTTEERLLSAQPAPFVTSKIRNMFVGYVAGQASTSYHIGDPGALVLVQHPLLKGVQYSVRISAVNAQGRMIAFTYGPSARLSDNYPGIIRFMYQDPATGSSQARYKYYRLGAYVVMPSNPS